jgi:hypothetical protein
MQAGCQRDGYLAGVTTRTFPQSDSGFPKHAP